MRIIDETTRGMTGRLIIVSRATAAARVQVRNVMKAAQNIIYEWRGVDEPNDLLLTGKADLAVFDADHLTYPLPDGLTVAALIKASDPFQENLAVLCRFDRADLRGLFYSSDIRNSYGKVWLVGAGPGAEDLITMRAVRVLAQADIVYYDDLLDGSLLSYCPGEHVYVGKRKGCTSHSQDSINELLYRSALEGKTIVRLKGGDPSIFGRAGEELGYLRHRWITVEIVPGVTSASAASAAGLFSLTQRRISRSINFRSGHGIDHSSQFSAENKTFVYYMAVSKLKEIAHDLLWEGVQPKTPVAIISNAGAWNETSLPCTVETMKNMVAQPPALVVVGNVAAHARIEKKVLFTGIDPSVVRVKEPVIHQPLIAPVSGTGRMVCTHGRQPYKSVEPLPEALDLSYFSAVIFSGPAEVDAFQAVYGDLPGHLLCYAADNRTRGALERKKINRLRIVSIRIQGKLAGGVHRVA